MVTPRSSAVRDASGTPRHVDATNAPRLVVTVGPNVPRAFPLVIPEDADAAFVIGRAPDADARLESDLAVSARHASIMQSGGRLFLVDLRSRNGTTLNGVLVPAGLAAPLDPGDVVGVGRSLLVLRRD